MRADQLFERGVAARAAQRLDEAAAWLAQAVALDPGFAQARINLGNLLVRLGDPEGAVLQYRAVLEQVPNYALAEMNLGVALTALNRHEEAIAAFDRALDVAPAFGEAQYRKALQLLRLGRFDQGWPLHEARWGCASHKPSAYADTPYWTGREDIAGQTLLVFGEQGFGDVLQFCRYLPLLAQRGARMILHVQPALWPLLGDLPGVVALGREGDAPPPFDRHVSLMSLPLALGGGIPSPGGYLAAPRDRVVHWARRLPRTGRPRVGLAWSGNPEHHDDHNRSMPAEALLGLATAEFEFVALQTQRRPGDAEAMAGAEVINLVGEIGDFADTAALAASCDLVISVDTSIAHLAGALGRPVWVLLPFSADWRWMTDTGACPWYDSARLFRQEAIGDWAGVLARVEAALRNDPLSL